VVLTWHGAALMKATRKAGIQALRELAVSEILPEAQKNVPKDTGLTASSGSVTDVKNGVIIAFTSMGEGGFPLAVHLHEDFNYTPRVSGTGPKYLERPFRAKSGGAKKRVETAVAAVLR